MLLRFRSIHAMALFLAGLLACDRIQTDPAAAATAESTTLRQTLFTQPGDALAIPLGAPTVYRVAVETAPKYGKLTFLTGGFLLYEPDAGYQAAEDQFVLARTNLRTTGDPKDTIRVVIKPDPGQFPCNAGAQADGARTPVNTPVTIAVIANDRFCAGEPDPATLKVTVPPKSGTTEVSGRNIVYKPNTGFKGTDTFVYAFSLRGSTTVLSAQVKIAVGEAEPTADCKPALANDAAVVREGTQEIVLDVLKNDRFCTNTGILSLKTQPRSGTVSISASNLLVYKPAAGFTGTLDFTYQVCAPNVTKECPSAVVKISVEPINPVCRSVANLDQVVVSLTGGRVEIPVLTNDVLCSPAQSLALVVKPVYGTALVDGMKIYYTPPATKKEADKFAYEVLTTKGEKVTGTVVVTLK